MDELTLVCPFYRNAGMLAEQIRHWNEYPQGIRIIVVDDGSPEPALPIVQEHASASLLERLRSYRIGVDIPWNRGGARNLGAHVAETDWLVHVDIDHVLPSQCAQRLMAFEPDSSRWYRFPRFRRGAADETRRKDAIARDVQYGAVKPHCDSYLVRRDVFLANPYDEDFSGCLGGGSPFLSRLEEVSTASLMPDEIFLEVYTRDAVKDSSDFSLSRDTSEYTRRRKLKEATGKTKAVNPLRFEWSRVL